MDRVIPRVAVLALAFLLAAGSLSFMAQSSSASSVSARPLARTIIAFDRSAADAEIVAALRDHVVTPSAVFTWTSGLTSTHRTHVARSPDALLVETRQSLIDSYSQGLRGNLIRLERFTALHSEADVASSSSLQTEARSLLGIRSQLEAALVALRRGDAIAYAVDVTGVPAGRAAALTRALRGRVVDGATGRGSMKPASFEHAWLDAALAQIPGSELHARMQEIVSATGGPGR